MYMVFPLRVIVELDPLEPGMQTTYPSLSARPVASEGEGDLAVEAAYPPM